jgi:hypothetical protein
MSNVNLTVGKMKELLKSLPDDMELIVPVGVLRNEYKSNPGLCLAATTDGKDIKTLLDENKIDEWCEKLLF